MPIAHSIYIVNLRYNTTDMHVTYNLGKGKNPDETK